MNKHIDQISQIRQLVELYYSGETTPEQDERLMSFFENADLSYLPVDLQEEAEVFRHLSALKPYDDKDLLAEIDQAIEKENNAIRPKKFSYWKFITSVAVAAAIIFAALTFINDFSARESRQKMENNNLQANTQVKTPAADTLTEITEPTPQTSQVAVPQPQKPAIAAKPLQPAPKTKAKPKNQPSVPAYHKNRSKSMAVVEKKAPEKTDDSPYTEITDPAEAAKVMRQVNQMFDRTFKVNYDTQQRIGNQLNELNERITVALNNI